MDDMQAARPLGPDLRSAAAALRFRPDIPAPLADGWHASRPGLNNQFRERTRFALFRGGQLVALVESMSRSGWWRWKIAIYPGGDAIVAGREGSLEATMLAAQEALNKAGAVNPARSAGLLARWGGGA